MGKVYTNEILSKFHEAMVDLNGGKFTHSALDNPKVLKLFKQITGRSVKAVTIYSIMNIFRGGTKMTNPKSKKKEDKFQVFKSEFVLVIDGYGVFGFKDEESVKTAIEKMDSVAMLGRAVHLFSRRKVKVECKII